MKIDKSEEFVYDSESGSEYEHEQYQPPKHFEKATLPASSASVEGKEIWLIKTPKGFPISKLKTLPVSFTASKVSNEGIAKVDVEGHQFQVNEDLFASETAKYTVLRKDLINKRFDRFYTIREVVDLPAIDYNVAIKEREDVEKIPNLRMRHFPSGYSARDYDEAKVLESRLDEDGKVIKKVKVEMDKKDKKDKKDKREKKEKKDKKDKKDKKEKKEKKERKSKKD